MKRIGVLWDDEVSWSGDAPGKEVINESYELFSEIAERGGVEIFLAKYTWYSSGTLEKAWVFRDGWEKVEDIEVEGIYDKFHFDEETEKLKKEIDEEVGILNDPELEKLCKDKLMTYREFSDRIPETRKASDHNIEEMLDEYGKVVLKPRYAFGGKGIEILENGDQIPDVDPDGYIVQRFIDSSGGVEGVVDSSHDLRTIIVDGEVQGGYVRFNDEMELMNVSQGASQKPLFPEDIPDEILEVSREISDEIQVEPAVYSVDLFVDGDGEVKVVELNSKPGLGFYGDEEMKKLITEVIESIVDCLKKI